jgi:Flp pilus assembly pilin Flp
MSWQTKSRSRALTRLERHEAEGQGLVEYAMLLLFVAIACVVSVSALGDTMIEHFWDVIQNVLIPAMGG